MISSKWKKKVWNHHLNPQWLKRSKVKIQWYVWLNMRKIPSDKDWLLRYTFLSWLTSHHFTHSAHLILSALEGIKIGIRLAFCLLFYYYSHLRLIVLRLSQLDGFDGLTPRFHCDTCGGAHCPCLNTDHHTTRTLHHHRHPDPRYF